MRTVSSLVMEELSDTWNNIAKRQRTPHFTELKNPHGESTDLQSQKDLEWGKFRVRPVVVDLGLVQVTPGNRVVPITAWSWGFQSLFSG